MRSTSCLSVCRAQEMASCRRAACQFSKHKTLLPVCKHGLPGVMMSKDAACQACALHFSVHRAWCVPASPSANEMQHHLAMHSRHRFSAQSAGMPPASAAGMPVSCQ